MPPSLTLTLPLPLLLLLSSFLSLCICALVFLLVSGLKTIGKTHRKYISKEDTVTYPVLTLSTTSFVTTRVSAPEQKIIRVLFCFVYFFVLGSSLAERTKKRKQSVAKASKRVFFHVLLLPASRTKTETKGSLLFRPLAKRPLRSLGKSIGSSVVLSFLSAIGQVLCLVHVDSPL